MLSNFFVVGIDAAEKRPFKRRKIRRPISCSFRKCQLFAAALTKSNYLLMCFSIRCPLMIIDIFLGAVCFPARSIRTFFYGKLASDSLRGLGICFTFLYHFFCGKRFSSNTSPLQNVTLGDLLNHSGCQCLSCMKSLHSLIGRCARCMSEEADLEEQSFFFYCPTSARFLPTKIPGSVNQS